MSLFLTMNQVEPMYNHHKGEYFSRAETECDGTRKRTGGEVKGKKANGGVASSRALYRTRSIQHYYR